MNINLSFLFICFVITCHGCHDNGDTTESKDDQRKHVLIEVPFYGKDTCFVFTKKGKTISVSRELEIVQNRLSDTVVFGTSVLLPGYKGKFEYYGIGSRIDISEDSDEDGIAHIRTDTFCIRRSRHDAKGSITLKAYY